MSTVHIRLDLGNTGAVFHALTSETARQRITNAAAQSYVDDTLDWIKAGLGFESKTGAIEQSIGFNPLGGGKAEVYVNADYAFYVEHGTGVYNGHSPWDVVPKTRKALKIPTGGVSSPVGQQLAGGGFIFRRKTHHEGARPFPFFFIDMLKREENMASIGRLVLAEVLRGV